MLRRLKSDAGLIIPPKKEVVIYTPLTSLQQNIYQSVFFEAMQLRERAVKCESSEV